MLIEHGFTIVKLVLNMELRNYFAQNKKNSTRPQVLNSTISQYLMSVDKGVRSGGQQGQMLPQLLKRMLSAPQPFQMLLSITVARRASFKPA